MDLEEELEIYEDYEQYFPQKKKKVINSLMTEKKKNNKPKFVNWVKSFLFTGIITYFAFQSYSLEKKIDSIQKKMDYAVIIPESITQKTHLVVEKQGLDTLTTQYLGEIKNSVPGDIALSINKADQTMQKYVLAWNLEEEYKVSTGKNYGNKQKVGDRKTPEGVFQITQIQNSENWEYEGEKAYGPKFLRLETPWEGIGIHGTNEPEKLGNPASHGCIRMESSEVKELSMQTKIGTKVFIYNNKK